jgi:prolyl oligopeptidase
MKTTISFLLALLGICQMIRAQEDKYLWLEEIDGKKALEFVENQNKLTLEKLSREKNYQLIYDKSLEIYDSPERIAYPTIHGNYVFNFWKDKDHARGIVRRCLLADYLRGRFEWETMLDIDELSKKEGVKWVFMGYSGLYPAYNRFLVELSKGGGDAVVIREFNADKKQFVENGFYIDEAKGVASYVDENTLVVATDFGKGTLTSSGYARQVRLWKRGTLLNDAQVIYEGDSTDMGTWGAVVRDGPQAYTVILRRMTIFSGQTMVWINNKAVKLDLPEDCDIQAILNNQLVLQLKSDWPVNAVTYKSGTLLSLNFNDLLKGEKKIQRIIEPDEFSSISGVVTTRNKLLVNLLTNITGQLYIYSFNNGEWTRQKVDAPNFGTISIIAANDLTDEYFFEFVDFITPSTLYYADAGKNTFQVHQSLPAYFDASKYMVKQYQAKSKDGTMIPYFMVSGKEMKHDTTNPTLVYAYGGFEISQQPFYGSAYGIAWLDNGGVFVLANIRGGGEFGPKWHQDGMKEKRQNVFDDLYAVSEDLISKKVTSPKHLGVMGGSNGGLLVGVAFTQRPDLYNAVVCQVPLLDMQRYNKLLAGASWTGEYGNPDVPEEWEYIRKYSPYQNLREGMNYPEVFFYTSTRDDRVHPGHARKMAARMNEMGYKTYYYENTEGGHAGSSTNEQRARSNALTFSYLLMKLK